MSAPGPVRLTVQIVTWNSADVIDACLESVRAQERSDVEVIVVDNASQDASAERVRTHFERGLRGRLVRSETNLGFCGGQNRAFAESSGELILFLNPDATLPSGFAAEAIELAAQKPQDVGLFAPRILLPDGRVDSAGLTIDRLRRAWDRGYGESADGRFAAEEEVFGCTGAVALYRRATLLDVAQDGQVSDSPPRSAPQFSAGPLDEKLFAYCDDVDLSWRARLRGWRCVYAPSLVAYHQRAGRNGLRAEAGRPRRVLEQRLMVRNRLLVIAKCERMRELLASLPLLLAFEALRIGFLLWRAPAVLHAYREAAALLPAVLRDRRRIQRARPGRAEAWPIARPTEGRIGSAA
jgi:GT2 family glycosyltransferase